MKLDAWLSKFAPHQGTHLHSELLRYIQNRTDSLKNSIVSCDIIDDIRITQGRLRELQKLESLLAPKLKGADTQ